ncbi:MAG TPA: PilN domain-containing protein [Methylomirabilota bacterium]|nr:PilN domain-containing protein [Methylomirabilota bacterium]
MAIKVNILRREAPRKAAGLSGISGISMPKLAIGGGRAIQAAGAVLVLVILVFAVMGYRAYAEKTDHEKKITQLKAQDAALQRQLVEVRLAETAKREIQRRLDIIGRVAKSQKVPVEMMAGVLKAVPQGIWLTSFDVKPQEVRVRVDPNRPAISYSSETLAKLADKKEETAGTPAGTQSARGPALPTKEVTEIQGYSVVIKGMAFNNFQVAEFMENLKKAGIFADVDFTVTQAANVESVRVMDFEVTANVKL